MDFELHQKQTVAFESTANEIFFGGAAGPGKSHLLRVVSIYLCAIIPKLQVYLFRRLSDDLSKNHMEGPNGYHSMLNELVMAKKCTITGRPGEVSFANGSKIHLCHCQYEKDKYKYQGTEIHVLLIDELTHFTESIYRYLRGRCRLPDALNVPEALKDKLPLILCASNPGNIGHNWVKNTFISPKPAYEIWETSDDEGGFNRQFIPALLTDNPSLDTAQYLRTLSGLGSEYLVKAMKKGDWDIIAGGMFDDVWNPDIHVIKPFEIPYTWQIDRSFDWGSSHPYSVGWWAESDGSDYTDGEGVERSSIPGDLFRIHEMYGWNGKPNEGTKETAVEIAAKIIAYEKAAEITVEPGPADSSIYNFENGKSIAGDMEAMGVFWTKANKSPGSRVNGWELIRQMLKDDEETPSMRIFDTCRQFIRTVPVLQRSEKKPDDVNTETEDHVGDEARYRVLAIGNRVDSDFNVIGAY